VLDASDLIMIHQLLARYGHAIDQRDWDGFAALFTPDASIDYIGGSGRAIVHGRDEVVAWFRAGDANHPPAHHVTNIVVDESADRDGPVEVHSKFIAPFSREQHVPKRLYGGNYRDLVVRTPGGWKFSFKHCQPTWNLALAVDTDAPPHRLTF
jgi:3-phenylpropionate/cinnamic acid dioxygenase small subunit